MYDPIVEQKINQLQRGRAERDAKRAKASAELAARQAAEEQRTCVSPNDSLLKERQKQIWDYWTKVRLANEERDRHEKIRDATPTLIKLKTDYMAEANSAKRVRLATSFVELYKKSYGKQVPVEVIMKEWDDERRKTFLARIYGAKHSTSCPTGRRKEPDEEN